MPGRARVHIPSSEISNATVNDSMDKLSVIGVILALVALLIGSVLKGAGLSSLWSPAAFVIVICGTIASILLQTSLVTFKRAMKITKWVFKPPSQDRAAILASLVEWANTARKQGLLGLESQVAEQQDAFTRKGLQMVVDGIAPDSIRAVLETDMHHQSQGDLAAAKVFEGMGIYAPTLGIIGAVLGLIAVMKNLADPSKLGGGIAAAFTATIYGIGAANLFLLPMANKLKALINAQTEEREMIVEGLIAIAQGENPRNIESRLAGYVH
jgi:chemotaxis protein MotA